MSDLISRQAAIDELTENKEMINAVLDSLTLDYNTRRNQEQRRGQINEDIETIKALPSAQPEPTLEQIEEYCHKRCLSIVDNALLHKYAQAEIIRCKDCKYQDENWRRVSVRWLPCMDVRTGSNWYCGSAERGEQ
jgi:hypothetical protein